MTGLHELFEHSKTMFRSRSLTQITFPRIFSIVDGGYSNWSVNSTCNATCDQGFETWFRRCNNPEPKYGGRNCSHLGKYLVLKRCSAKSCLGELNSEDN